MNKFDEVDKEFDNLFKTKEGMVEGVYRIYKSDFDAIKSFWHSKITEEVKEERKRIAEKLYKTIGDEPQSIPDYVGWKFRKELIDELVASFTQKKGEKI